MSTLVMMLWTLAVISTVCIAQLSGELTTPMAPLASTMSDTCNQCLAVNTCETTGSECLCHSGISGPTCDTCALDCQNAGRCEIVNGRGECRCINATTGPRCQVYHTPAIASLVGNVAGSASVFQCRAGGLYINLANSSLWKDHVCYNISFDDVILVDLGERYDVSRVSVAVYNTPFVNMTISVGERLADMCDVMNGVTCGQVVDGISAFSPLRTSVCSHVVTGRYIRIRSTWAVVCLVSVVGSSNKLTHTTAHFRTNENMFPLSQVPSFEESYSASKLQCARRCVNRPRCLNFRWNSTHCLMYGGSAGLSAALLTYTWL